MITRKFLSEFFDTNYDRCQKGIDAAIVQFSIGVTDWNREQMRDAFHEYRMYAAEFEGIMQRVLDEQQEAENG